MYKQLENNILYYFQKDILMDLELYTYQNDNCDVPNDNKPFPDWVDEYNNLQRENLLPICKLLISSEECSNNVVENEFRVDILLY